MSLDDTQTPEQRRELEIYYSNYFELFTRPGWKQLVKDLTEDAQRLNSVEHTKDGEDLAQRKGSIAVLAHVINLPDTVRQAYDSVFAEDANVIEEG